jgi:hypothetical protein
LKKTSWIFSEKKRVSQVLVPAMNCSGGPVSPQQSLVATFPSQLGRPENDAAAGAPTLPTNPFPELAQRRLRWNG